MLLTILFVVAMKKNAAPKRGCTKATRDRANDANTGGAANSDARHVFALADVSPSITAGHSHTFDKLADRLGRAGKGSNLSR